MFTFYLQTKNFHWHVSGSHFHDYHLMLDEQGDQLFAMTDDIAERARKLGARTIHSIGDIAKSQRLSDNDKEQVAAQAMLRELHGDNQRLAEFMRSTHAVCDEHGDLATASLLENWIDQTERRSWFCPRPSGILNDSWVSLAAGVYAKSIINSVFALRRPNHMKESLKGEIHALQG